MSKKTKTKTGQSRTPRTAKRSRKPKTPKLGEASEVNTEETGGEFKPSNRADAIFGHPKTAVIRALAAKKLTNSHIHAIVAARGIVMSEKSINAQIFIGRHADGKFARNMIELTKEQFEELRDSAPDPKADVTAA